MNIGRLSGVGVLLVLAACVRAPVPGDGTGLAPATFGSAGFDNAADLARHSVGVYVVGSTSGGLYGPNRGGNDAFISKYYTNGTTAWSKQFGTPAADQANRVAAGGGDTAYVVGTTRGRLAATPGAEDVFVRKYAPDGTAVWTRQFGTPATDRGTGVATYGSRVVYVVGTTNGDLAGRKGGRDAFIRRYDAGGGVAWTRQFGSSAGDTATGVAVDARGNAYVVGYTQGSLSAPLVGEADLFIRKYTPGGGVAWTRQLHYSTYDYAQAVAVAGGDVYVVGWVRSPDPEASDPLDVLVLRFSTSGSLAWDEQFGTALNDFAADASADASGVAVSGSTNGAFGPEPNQGEFDGFVVKLDRRGDRRWLTHQGTSGTDSTDAVLLQGDRVYAAGRTSGVLGSANLGAYDAFLRQLAGADGSTVWTD